MTLSWRLLRLRDRLGPCARSSVQYFSRLELQSQPKPDSARSLSSLIQARSFHGNLSASQSILPSHGAISINPRTQLFRRFSSQSEIEIGDSDLSAVREIFSESRDSEEIRRRLEAKSIVIDYDWVLSVLAKLESSPEGAKTFFDWVSKSDEARFLSSKSYNLMLMSLGVNGSVNEFWGLFEVMKQKGFGVSRFVRDRVLERFMKEGSVSNVKKLKCLFDKGSTDQSDEKIASMVCRIIGNEDWSDDIKKKLHDLNPKFSSHMVSMVLERLHSDPTKALLFFRWLEESDSFKHDEGTYNAMAKVLGREDSVDDFWKLLDEMKGLGFNLHSHNFESVFVQFVKRKTLGDAVKLYEFVVVGGLNYKPSVDCGVFLLKKISSAPNLDMGLFSRVARVNHLTDSTLESVVKSLISVGRIGEIPEVLKAMEGLGYRASSNMRVRIVSLLCTAKKKNEAIEFASITESDPMIWDSLIRGLSATGDLGNASKCLRKMVDSQGPGPASSPLQSVVDAYCRRKKAVGAYKFLRDLVIEKQVRPRPSTYRFLITGLLAQEGFGEATSLMGLMKDQGITPFVAPFFGHFSKSGTVDEAAAVLKAASKTVASPVLFIRVFEAFFDGGRHDKAQLFLSKCPPVIRNHPDVLNLFASKVG